MMKSCMIDNPAETQLDLQCLPIAVLQEDNYFDTVPIAVVLPGCVESSEDEEALYTSFEEAISDRVARVSRQLSQLPSAVATHTFPTTNPMARAIEPPLSLPRVIQRFWSERQRAVVLVCLCLSLLMAGFDLMGLLVLSR